MKLPRILPLVLLAPLSFASPPAADPAAADCDRVLCYFAGTRSKVEWRIYDPARGTDKTFLTLLEVPGLGPRLVCDRLVAGLQLLERVLRRRDDLVHRIPQEGSLHGVERARIP